MTYWDPIGVNGIPEASDEYDSYLARWQRSSVKGPTHMGI